jgi:MinD superfamily P-loop ATPase
MRVSMAAEEDNMRIAVLSGKGGTGKTMVSVNLATVAGKADYIDCDVEEPNGYLFFKPENIRSEKITIKIPKVDEKLCDGCRECVDFCKFNALAYISNKLMIFKEVCHSCGGCVLFCPKRALEETDKSIGEIHRGISGDVNVSTGILNIGEASGIPIISYLLRNPSLTSGYTIIDCPPGSACIVMESIKDSDYCILVTEPTIFGVHNLNMVLELVKLFNKPFGVLLNKCIEGENPAETFCIENNIKIIGRIPFDKELSEINSKALIAARESKKYKEMFSQIFKIVTEEVQK